ncbi:SPOR domain-containing protein [Neptunicella sp. SCSIO 80796]|uniref:SPOR domain-containing protein n=1 Tax=Neptunicella plasticusilytica TaxID=3117012 RepID=UPI003A4D76D0
MASAFQNRLIGTIVLVALAVIFLPDILDGEKVSHKDSFVPIPQRPVSKPVANTTAFPHQQVNQAVTRQVEIVTDPVLDDESAAVAMSDGQSQTSGKVDDAQPGQQNKVQTSAELTALEKQIQNEEVSAGWVVQLGVFRHDKNVRELLTKLQGAGYRAFSNKIQTSSGELTKVFVGPDVDKQKMEKAIPHLKQITNLKGRVTEFKVK